MDKEETILRARMDALEQRIQSQEAFRQGATRWVDFMNQLEARIKELESRCSRCGFGHKVCACMGECVRRIEALEAERDLFAKASEAAELRIVELRSENERLTIQLANEKFLREGQEKVLEARRIEAQQLRRDVEQLQIALNRAHA
jgi:valyl-tRNA synthetase